jgi:aromatic ring hydroxylase
MNTKLTLSIDDKIIKQAKEFAKQRNKSLSKLIEDYLGGIISKTPSNDENIPPVTKKLAGILKGKKEINTKNDISTFLEKKYK